MPNRPKSIFVSSTFRDMQSERDVLRDIVLPKVNVFASVYGESVELIDLRWGIDTGGEDEEGQNNKVLRTCLEEIRRSRPFFLGLLGDRYGWIPPERDMANALEAEGYEAESLDKSVTALEIEYGALRFGSPRCLFYFRELDYTGIKPEVHGVYRDGGEAGGRLAALKEEIRRKFGGAVKAYPARFENGYVNGLESFAETAEADIIAMLRDEWGEPPAEPVSDYERELAAQEAFRRASIRDFTGRTELTSELREFCLGGDGFGLMLLQGTPGSGKSAALYKVMEEIEDKCLTLPFTFGLTQNGAGTDGFLRRCVNIMENFLELESETLPEAGERQALRERFTELLYLTAQKKRVVIAADALDRVMGEGERNLSWLEGAPRENLRVLCTGIGLWETSAASGMGGVIKQMPGMEADDAAKLVRLLASRLHKELSEEVAAHIAERAPDEGYSPLYLSLTVQDLVMLDRYEHASIDAYAARGLTPMEAINRFMTERVDSIPADADRAFLAVTGRIKNLIGENFVAITLNAIATSLNGLRERDLEGVFAEMGAAWSAADFAWLRQMLGAHLTQGADLQWRFASQTGERAFWLYGERGYRRAINGRLVDYMLKNAGDDFICGQLLFQCYLSERHADAVQAVCADGGLHSRDFKNNLVYLAVTQSGTDEDDFLKCLLDAAAGLTDENRWRVAALFDASLFERLPASYLGPEWLRRDFRILNSALTLAESCGQGDEVRETLAVINSSIGDRCMSREDEETRRVACHHYLEAYRISKALYGELRAPARLAKYALELGKLTECLAALAGKGGEQFLEGCAGELADQCRVLRNMPLEEEQFAVLIKGYSVVVSGMRCLGRQADAYEYAEMLIECCGIGYDFTGSPKALEPEYAVRKMLAEDLEWAGEIAKAKTHRERCHELARRIYQISGSRRAQERVGECMIDLAAFYAYLTKDSGKAEQISRQALSLWGEMYTKHPTVVSARWLIKANIMLAQMLMLRDAGEEAAEIALAAFPFAEELAGETQDDRDWYLLNALDALFGGKLKLMFNADDGRK